MSLEKELAFLYESGMTEDELIAQAMADSMGTAQMDEEQTSARQVIRKTESETIESEKEATRALRAQQDMEYAESLRQDRGKESLKFGKMLEEAIVSVDKTEEYDFDWSEEDTIAHFGGRIQKPDETPKEEPKIQISSREQLRQARLKFFTK